MTEQICQYCGNKIRPLDNHAVNIKNAGTVIRVDSPNPILLQEVTCILTRTVIANIKQTGES